MSALAMILVAGIAIGDGPGKVSGEQKPPKPLNLRDAWEGDFTWEMEPKKTCKVEATGDNFSIYDKRKTWYTWKVVVATKGRFEARGYDDVHFRGTYEQQEDRVLIRIHSAEDTQSKTSRTYEKPILIKLRRIQVRSMPKVAD